MKKYNNWNNVQAVQELEAPVAGGYECVIVNVIDNEQKEYLEIQYDIAEGKSKGYYADHFDKYNWWAAKTYKSYKESAISFFKGFINAIEESNQGYQWDWYEQGLVGKKIGFVLREEEYIPSTGKYAGQIRTRLVVDQTKTIKDIQDGKFVVKPKKTVSKDNINNIYDAQPVMQSQPQQPATGQTTQYAGSFADLTSFDMDTDIEF